METTRRGRGVSQQEYQKTWSQNEAGFLSRKQLNRGKNVFEIYSPRASLMKSLKGLIMISESYACSVGTGCDGEFSGIRTVDHRFIINAAGGLSKSSSTQI